MHHTPKMGAGRRMQLTVFIATCSNLFESVADNAAFARFKLFDRGYVVSTQIFGKIKQRSNILASPNWSK